MSWLAPVLNNRVGDRLNLELRHEQLFFIQGDRVLDDIGYSEKGKRFSEAEFGKPIRSLDDLKRNGYWLVGREYDPSVMREALAGQKDGYYYSIFANQCQDWTDRLRRSAERLEAENGLDTQRYSRRVNPPRTTASRCRRQNLHRFGWVSWLLLSALRQSLNRSLPAICSLFSSESCSLFRRVTHRVWPACRGLAKLSASLVSRHGAFGRWRLTLMNLRFAEVATGTLLRIMIAVQGVNSLVVGAGNRPLRRGLARSQREPPCLPARF